MEERRDKADGLQKTLKKLQKELKREYPPHHYKHVNIASAYWSLVDRIKE